MTHSSFYQPLPKSLASFVSEGYRDDTTKPAVGFEILNPVGAGGLSSSAADMGRFGQMLLNGGTLDGAQHPEARNPGPDVDAAVSGQPAAPPICMGFYQDWRNNLRWIGHEGDLIAFHSLFFVEPHAEAPPLRLLQLRRRRRPAPPRDHRLLLRPLLPRRARRSPSSPSPPATSATSPAAIRPPAAPIPPSFAS